jgi:hypothetical protein
MTPMTFEALPAKFIALTPRHMNWSDAKAWCVSQGGKMPLVNNSASWDGSLPASIAGFGPPGSDWPAGLPFGLYWTGAEHSDNTNFAWVVFDFGGKVGIGAIDQDYGLSVVCVS